jgi:small subunit ribosomal protein S2
MKEKIAVREAQRLSIPIFGMVDTNSDPNGIDFVIPANDDASQSIDLIVGVMCDAIKDGLSDRKVERDNDDKDEKPLSTLKKGRKAVAKIIVEDDEEVEADDKEEILEEELDAILEDDELIEEDEDEEAAGEVK